MAATDDLGSIIQADARGRRWRWIAAGVAVALAVAVGTYVFVHRGGGTVAVAPTPATVTRGTLAITSTTTGTAAAAKSTDLSFTGAGVVTAVDVKPGEQVKQGQVLAQVDPTDAQRSLDSAKASLQSAQLKLQALVAPPTYASDVASADQSVASAQTQLLNAQQALDTLLNPTQSDLDAAHQAVLSAQASLSTADQNYKNLLNPAPPTDADITAADASVTQAQVSLTNAQNQVATALPTLNSAWSSYCTTSFTTNYTPLSDVCAGQLPLTSAKVDELNAAILPTASPTNTQISRTTSLISANASYVSALGQQSTAEINLTSAQQKRDAVVNPTPATAQQVYQARSQLDAAQLALSAAQQKEQALLHPTADDIASAQNAVAGAQAGLASAQARAASTKAGTDPSTLAQQQIAVQQAEAQVASAQEALDGLTLKAPFDGVVGAISVQQGARVAAGTAAVTVLDPNAMVVNLTVSETDLPNMKAGLLGFVTFDALPNDRYIVQVASVGTVPTVSQGVVTYPVQAEILTGQQLAAVGSQLQGLAAAFGGGRTGAGFAARASGTPAADATAGANATAAAGAAGAAARTRNGAGTGAGAGAGTGAGTGAGGGTGRGGFGGGLAALGQSQVMPAPGMSATITLLTSEKSDVLLLPASAVHTQGRTSFVYVPDANGAPVQKDVVVGSSNGTQVEITSGLNEGDTVLLNVATQASTASTTTTGNAGAGGQGGAFFAGGGTGGGNRGGGTGGLR